MGFGGSDIDHAGIQYLSGLIDDGDLASGPVARIEPDNDLVFYKRLHKQVVKIDFKHLHRLFLGVFGQFAPYLALYRRTYKPLIRIQNSFAYILGCNRRRLFKLAPV